MTLVCFGTNAAASMFGRTYSFFAQGSTTPGGTRSADPFSLAPIPARNYATLAQNEFEIRFAGGTPTISTPLTAFCATVTGTGSLHFSENSTDPMVDILNFFGFGGTGHVVREISPMLMSGDIANGQTLTARGVEAVQRVWIGNGRVIPGSVTGGLAPTDFGRFPRVDVTSGRTPSGAFAGFRWRNLGQRHTFQFSDIPVSWMETVGAELYDWLLDNGAYWRLYGEQMFYGWCPEGPGEPTRKSPGLYDWNLTLQA